jgi:hypothetical protein
LLPTAATAVTAVAGIAIAGYLVVFRPGNVPNSGAAIAAAAVSSSRAVAVLEQQRQQMIVMSAASHTMRIIGAPKVAAQPSQASGGTAGSTGGAGGVPVAPPDPGTAQRIAYNMLSSFGWSPSTYYSCLNNIWTRESGWRYNAENASGAYGIPQALPGSKMASAGADWMTNPATQIKWGLGYIQGRYGDPCSAWSYWEAHGYY